MAQGLSARPRHRLWGPNLTEQMPAGREAARIFMSYRRQDAAHASRLYEDLRSELPAGTILVDVGALRPGLGWPMQVREAVGASDMLLAVIGPSWLEATTARERADFVGTALEAALSEGLPVVPLLVGGATMPASEQLPPPLAKLAGIQAAVLEEAAWRENVQRLARSLRRIRLRPRDTAAPAPPGRPRPPSALPDLPSFVNREHEREELEAALTRPGPPGARIVVVTGPGGIGKSALAVTVAHQLRSRFPDGQLHASLGEAADERKVLGQLLQASGFDLSELPDDIELQAETYQSLLAARRVLVVLDDIRSIDQVRMLQPLGINCAAVLTMRSVPPELAHAPTVRLAPLEEPEALALLRLVAGASFVNDHPDAARELVRKVGGSPLSLQLIGAAARESAADPETLLERLGTRIRDIVAPLYDSLQDGQRRLLRLLAVLPEPEFDTGLAGAIAELGQEEAAVAVRSLLGNAVLVGSGADRYRLPELVQQFARERLAAEETEADQQAALRRAIGWIAISTAYRPEAPLTRDYWTHEDALGHGPYADAIAAFIQHPDTRPPLTIAIKAPWGAGKTSLMRMVQQRLDPRADLASWSPCELRLKPTPLESLRPSVRRGRWWSRWPGGDGQVTNLELLRRASQPPPVETVGLGPRLDNEAPAAPALGGRDEQWRPTVWFNPWMYQSGDQIWAGLAHEIIGQVTERLVVGDRERFWLELNLRRVDRQAVRRRVYRLLFERFLPLLLAFAIAGLLAAAAVMASLVVPSAAHAVRTAGAALASSTGVAAAVLAVIQTFRFLTDKASGPFSQLLRSPDLVKGSSSLATGELKGAYGQLLPDPGYEGKLGFLHLVQTDMRRVLSLVATEPRPLVVFVDDLDRCSPGAVAQAIEAINLFLAGQFPNCIFVLAMEPAVVAAHVEVVYKDLAENLRSGRVPGDRVMLGWQFLEKIVQLPLSLPPPDSEAQVPGYVAALLDGPSVGATAASTTDGADRPGPRDPDREAVSTPAVEPTSAPAALTTPVTAADPADAASTVAAADLTRRLETAIRRRSPTVERLPELAREAQQEVLGAAATQLRQETIAAANRVLVEIYSDAEARAAILDGVPEIASGNPRQIKRFVNLFRFYTFVAQQHRLQGRPAPMGKAIAKLAVIAIRWPHLLHTFGAPAGGGGGSILLQLERQAREPDPGAGPPGATDGWRTALIDAGLVPDEAQWAAHEAWTEQLRLFLARDPPVAADALRLL